MKYTIKVSTLIIISTLLGFMSCEKEIPYGHPTCDTCDWDVMTCKVDGVSWQARKKCELLSNCDPVDCQYYSELKYLEINGFQLAPESSIKLDNFGKELKIGRNEIYRRSFNFVCSGCSPAIPRSQLDSNFTNYIDIIQIDTIKRIVEGTFELQLLNSNEVKIKITEGYFKLTYRY